jgi:trigger factor
MDPNEFVQILSQQGQIPAMVGEVARNKALAIALGKAKVTDAAGNAVDLSEFTAVSDADATEADAAAETAEAAEAPVEEPKPARKRAAKKADADEAPAEAEADAEEPKKPTRKRAPKKADAE